MIYTDIEANKVVWRYEVANHMRALKNSIFRNLGNWQQGHISVTIMLFRDALKPLSLRESPKERWDALSLIFRLPWLKIVKDWEKIDRQLLIDSFDSMRERMDDRSIKWQSQKLRQLIWYGRLKTCIAYLCSILQYPKTY